MVLWQKTMYKCSLKRVPGKDFVIPRLRAESLLNTGVGGFKHVDSSSIQISFVELARSIEMDDMNNVDRALALPPMQVEFTDSSTGATILHIAAKYSGPIIEKLLTSENMLAYLNAEDIRGTTPLIAATWYGNVAGMRALLKKGARPSDMMFGNNRTCLHIAAAHDNEEVVETILDSVYHPGLLDMVDEDGDTALMVATELNTKAVFHLIKAGASHRLKNPITGRNIMHLAVLHERHELIHEFIRRFPEPDFLTAFDKNGDTPLMLAIKVLDPFSAHLLLSHVNAKDLVNNYHDIIHDIIAMDDYDLLQKVLFYSEPDVVNNWTNATGDTALMCAIEHREIKMINLLLMRVQLTAQKDQLGFTVAHEAAMTGDVKIIQAILAAKNIKEIINIPDADGTTPYEMVLGTSNMACLRAFRDSGMIDDSNVNGRSESALYVAAKQNNYGIVLALLLSDGCNDYFAGADIFGMAVHDIHKIFMKGYITASDVYILIGRTPPKSIEATAPEQHYLFRTNANGRNIFHACALGGGVNCLIFIYNYCALFHPDILKLIDAVDDQGSSPLLLACLSEHTEIIEFLAVKGANICKENNSGLTPLKAIPTHVMSYKQLVMNLFDNCIVSDQGLLKQKSGKDLLRLTVYYNILSPKGYKQMFVINEVFKVLHGPQNLELLSHPFIAYFVWSVWKRVHWTFKARFNICFIQTIIFSIYLTFKYCRALNYSSHGVSILWWATFISCISSFLVNIPSGLMSQRVSAFSGIMSKLRVVSPMICMLYLAFFDGDDRTSLEFGSFGVLFSWLTLFAHGIGSPISKQIAMFQLVFFAMVRYSPIFLLVMMSFSFYFFTLFHEYLIFNNPFHSFLFTAFQLPEGDLSLVPTLNEHTSPIRMNQSNYSVVASAGSNSTYIIPKKEARGMLLEGTTIVLYVLYVTSLMNMLTALAVRSGEEIELGGDVVSLSMKIRRMVQWESILSNPIFPCLKKYRLPLIFMLIPTSLSEVFKLPSKVHPLTEETYGFDLFQLKQHVVEKPDLITNRIVPKLTEFSFDKSSSDIETAEKPEQKPSFNKMFLEV